MNHIDISVWMRRLGELSRNGDGLPDPDLIWWKARLLEQQEARRRVRRPVSIAQWASAAVAVAACIALYIQHSTAIQGIFDRLLGVTTVLAAAICVLATVVALRLSSAAD